MDLPFAVLEGREASSAKCCLSLTCLDFSEDLVRRFAEFISGLVPICVHGVFGEPRRVGSVGVLGFLLP